MLKNIPKHPLYDQSGLRFTANTKILILWGILIDFGLVPGLLAALTARLGAECTVSDRRRCCAGIPQRMSPSTSRRAGAGRASGKRRLSDEARHERKVGGGGQRGPLALRGHSPAATSGVTAAAVATQAGFVTGPPLGPPPPPQPPAGLLRPAEEVDSGPADSGADTSTSNDEDTAAFPLHFGPGLFDGLDPAEAARAMAEAINFR